MSSVGPDRIPVLNAVAAAKPKSAMPKSYDAPSSLHLFQSFSLHAAFWVLIASLVEVTKVTLFIILRCMWVDVSLGGRVVLAGVLPKPNPKFWETHRHKPSVSLCNPM